MIFKENGTFKKRGYQGIPEKQTSGRKGTIEKFRGVQKVDIVMIFVERKREIRQIRVTKEFQKNELVQKFGCAQKFGKASHSNKSGVPRNSRKSGTCEKFEGS